MDVDVNKVCRGCMNESDAVSSQIPTLAFTNSDYCEMFTYCTTIELSRSDGTPILFCPPCCDKMCIAYNFIKTCREVNNSLKSIVKEIKIENEKTNIKIKSEFESTSNCFSNIEFKQEIDNYEYPTFEMDDNDDDDDEYNLDELGEFESRDESTSDYTKHERVDVDGERVKKKYYKSRMKPKICALCGEGFSWKKELREHMRSHHDDYKEFKCDYCDKGFTRPWCLRQHLLLHRETKPFTCDICGKCYKQRSQLLLHCRMHTLEKQFKCDLCPLSFKLRRGLEIHKRNHDEHQTHLCDLCGKGFKQVGNLAVHMRTHTGERPYRCEVCGFSCTTMSILRRHSRRHTGLRVHSCHTCGKMFNDSTGLTRHIRVHTGERPYPCPHCPSAFQNSWKRKTHMIKVHNVALEDIPKLTQTRKPPEHSMRVLSPITAKLL